MTTSSPDSSSRIVHLRISHRQALVTRRTDQLTKTFRAQNTRHCVTAVVHVKASCTTKVAPYGHWSGWLKYKLCARSLDVAPQQRIPQSTFIVQFEYANSRQRLGRCESRRHGHLPRLLWSSDERILAVLDRVFPTIRDLARLSIHLDLREAPLFGIQHLNLPLRVTGSKLTALLGLRLLTTRTLSA